MRALLLDPEVLLLDEPLAALDPLVRTELRDDLRGIFRSLGQDGHRRHARRRRGGAPGGRRRADARRPRRPAGPVRDARRRARRRVRRGVPRDRERDAPAAPSRGDDGDGARRDAGLRWRAVAACGGRARRAGRASSSASKGFTESVILGEMVAALARGAGVPRRAPPAARRHRGRVPRARDRRGRRLSRVHRDADQGDPARRDGARRGPLADVLAGHGLRMTPAARLRQQLRAGDDRGARRRARHPPHLRPARAPRAALVVSQRVHEPRRRLARPARALRPAATRRAAWTTTSPTARSRAAPPTSPTSTRPTPRSSAYALRVLDDDRQLLHRATRRVLLYRADLPTRAPAVVAAIERLQGRLDNADDDRAQRARQAGSRPRERGRRRLPRPRTSAAPSTARRARARARADRGRAAEHTRAGRRCRCSPRSPLAVPLGIVAARRPRLGRVVVGAAGPAADHPVARAAGAADPAARHRLAARDRGAVPLRPAADRAQHARRPGRHPRVAAALGARARPAARARACASSSCRWRCRPSSPASRRRR